MAVATNKTVRVYPLELKKEIELALSRVTRSWNADECSDKLRRDVCPATMVALERFIEGKERAVVGDVDGSVARLREAQALSPMLDFDAQAKARQWAASALISEAEHLLVYAPVLEKPAAQTHVEKATKDFANARELDQSQISAISWNSLCWFGSLSGYSAKVMYACEQAVTLAKRDQVAECRDSRGVARVLTGDYPGALDDFSAFVEWASEREGYIAQVSKRKAWIKELEAGRNPLGDMTLKSLLQE